MAEFYVKNGWGVFPYPTITKLGAMGGRAAPVPYPQLCLPRACPAISGAVRKGLRA